MAGKKRHGMCGNETYNSWSGLKRRCDNKNDPRYKDYGGRGITYDPRWAKFEEFYKDMGDKPKGTSIDRIDNNGNYCRENCRWATPKEQQNNQRVTIRYSYNGQNKTLREWAKELNIKPHTLKCRVYRGWSIERAVNTEKLDLNKYITYKEETKTKTQWAKQIGISLGRFNWRLRQGWSIQKAITTPVLTNRRNRMVKWCK